MSKIKKYKYAGLIVELTRRCNMACAHCVRGDAQDVTISREVIDAIIENFDECNSVQFTGGEPLLALDELEYFIDKVIERGRSVDELSFITNGAICDRRVVEMLKRFCDSKDGRKATISVSSDKYHSREATEKALVFYRTQAKDTPSIIVIPNGEIGERYTKGVMAFVRAGRGEEIDSGLSDELIRDESTIDHRICVAGETVRCLLQINASGDVCLFDMRSYATLDSMALGNILDEPLAEIIDRFNAECLITCTEVQTLEQLQVWRSFKTTLRQNGMSWINYYESEIVADIAVSVFRRVLAARKLAHEKYPAVPAQDIIMSLPVPKIACFGNYILQGIAYETEGFNTDDIAKYIPSKTLLSFSNAYEQADDLLPREKAEHYQQIDDLMKIVIGLNKPGAVVAARRFYGSGNVEEKAEFRRLERLNGKYVSGECERDNSMVFCDPDWSMEKNIKEAVLEDKMLGSFEAIFSPTEINIWRQLLK